MNNNFILTGQIGELVFEMPFIPVKDRPGYFYFGDSATVISEETLKKAINEYDKNLYKLLLSD